MQLWLKMSLTILYMSISRVELSSYHLLVAVWQELCAIHSVQTSSDAKKQLPSKPSVSQTLRHRIQL